MLAQHCSNSDRLLRIACVPSIANRIHAIRRSSKAFLDVAGPALTDSLPAEVCGENTAGGHAVAAALGGQAGTLQVARPDGGTGARQGANHRRSRGLLVLGEGDFLEDNRRADHSISRYWRGSRSKRAILVGDHTVV